MNDRQLLIAITALFAIAAIGLILESYYQINPALTSIALVLGKLLTLNLLVHHSGFLKSIYAKVILVFFIVTIIGALLKIMHWTGANLIYSSGLTGIALTYTWRFIAKSSKVVLDYLKLLWVCATCVVSISIILHIEIGYFSVATNLILLLIVAELWRMVLRPATAEE